MLEQQMLSIGNDDFMPQIKPDVKELLIFRAWAGSGWVKPMYWFSLITISITLILAMIYVGYQGDTAYIFFGICSILLVCVGSVIYHRIIYEMVMGCLQIPRLIIAVDKLEASMRLKLEGTQVDGTNVEVVHSIDGVGADDLVDHID